MTVDNYVDQLVDDATTTLRKLTKSTMRDLYNESFELGFKSGQDTIQQDNEESHKVSYDDGYAAGVEAAWKTAKMVHDMSVETRLRVLGHTYGYTPFDIDPVEAIQKLSKNAEKAEPEFSKIPVIGDEVALPNLAKFVVTHYDADLKTVDGIMLDGTVVSDISIDAVKRTGRIYGQFAEFFAKEK